MSTSMTLLGPDGSALPARAPATAPARRRVSASLNGSASQFFPYDAAQWFSQEMGDWLPWIRSPDTEINPYRDRMVARGRDLARNDGWASGGITRVADNVIGASFRLSAKPDWRALARFSSGFDASWAAEFANAAEAIWRGWAEDLGHYNDVSRQLTFTQQLYVAFRHKLIDGEALGILHWLPERIGYGAAHYATGLLGVDPDRLSNPYEQMDTKNLRGGVEIDDDGVPVAYHIRRAHQNDWYNAVESMAWDRILRETPDGRPIVIHDFDRDRFGQNRGVGIFTPVLQRLKMLTKYDAVELQAAVINAIFAAFITSPFDSTLVQEALDPATADGGFLSAYQQLRTTFHEDRSLMLGGARIPTLVPGEKIETVAASRPSQVFDAFEHAMLRNFAAQLGASAEQVTWDWSKSNYSSARGALLEAWKTMMRRAGDFKVNLPTKTYAAVLEEAVDLGELPLPTGAPDFPEARAAYARCKWIGPGRGWIDPVAEKQGSVLGMDAGLSTLEQECAENAGSDWEEVLDQRAREIKRFEELGIPVPTWAGTQWATSPMDASEASQKPPTPQPA